MTDSKNLIDYDEKLCEQRLQEVNRLRDKHQNRIPVLVKRDSKCTDIPEIDKSKYLVPDDLTMGQFVFVIRKRLSNLPPEKALFVFVRNTLPPTGQTLSAIYQKHKDKDGFLRITYSGENTFG